MQASSLYFVAWEHAGFDVYHTIVFFFFFFLQLTINCCDVFFDLESIFLCFCQAATAVSGTLMLCEGKNEPVECRT